jgi:hypothetical protein
MGGGGSTGGGGGTAGGGGGTAGGGGGTLGGGGGSTGGGGGSTSDGGVDAGVPDAGPRSANPRLFTTSATFTGDIVTAGGGGDPVSAGDRLCAGAAADAGLTGTWRAFIADRSDSAMTRHHAGAPYRLVGTSTQVFRTASKLAQPPEVPLNRSEFGAVLPASAVWTGTDPGGSNDGSDCSIWASAASTGRGSVGFTNDAGAWTGAFNSPCDQQARLYCFEY